MRAPAFLKKNDCIALAATAKKVEPEDLKECIEFLEAEGFRVKLPEHIYDSCHQFAGTDEIRTADFQQLIDDEYIKAILCVRGGYGTVRIIDQLDFSKFVQSPKWICGFSDVTVLHSHIIQNYHIQTIHSKMAFNITHQNKTCKSVQTLLSALRGESLNYEISPHPFNREGQVTAKLVGGNLSILYSLLGSSSDICTDNRILFIEDLDEYLYHIDRMMMNMKRNGKFKNLAGLIVGGMSDMNDNKIPYGKTAEEIIAEYSRQMSVPVCFGFPAGHLAENHALIMGKEVHLKISKNAVSLTI